MSPPSRNQTTTVPRRRPARPHSSSTSRSPRRQWAAAKPIIVTAPNSRTKTMIAVQFMFVSLFRHVDTKCRLRLVVLVMHPNDQSGGENYPEELIPIKKRDTPQGRFDEIIERHPEQGD